MPKRRQRKRFKLGEISFKPLSDGLARLRLAYRDMDWHRGYRVVLSVVVIGSLMGLVFYGDLTNMPSGVQAPLFAIIAAMGLAVTVKARADQTWEKRLKLAVSLTAIAAVGLSGFQWLMSQDAGTWIRLLGVVGTALAMLALAVNVHDMAEEEDRADEGG